MYVSLNWLRRYLPSVGDADAVAAALTMAGYPVVAVEAVKNADGSPDQRLDVEITSNRPDLQSHLGIARELHGTFGGDFSWPVVPSPANTDDVVSVANEAPDACPLYSARVVRGVKVGPSPAWLQDLLGAVGQRCINNVVDVTNFVLLECGHPLHAFDLAKLAGARLVARSGANEQLSTLDGRRLTLGVDDLVIADAQSPVALAGVMGGLDSEVTDNTVDVALECALFDPLAVRHASRRHQTRTESSFRFERFVDPARAAWASDRAAALLVELAGATSVGPIVGAGPAAEAGADSIVHTATIDLRTAQIRRIIGIEVPEAEVVHLLSSLGLTPDESAPTGATRWRVPTWRPDLEAEIDLIEEIARRVGFDRVPSEVRIPVRPLSVDVSASIALRLRNALVAAGLRECCTEPFVGDGPLDISLFDDRPALRVENPMRATREPTSSFASRSAAAGGARQPRSRRCARPFLRERKRLSAPEYRRPDGRTRVDCGRDLWPLR